MTPAVTQSNFSFLKTKQWRAFFPACADAEQFARTAPDHACILCRKSVEQWLRWLFDHDGTLRLPYETTLHAMLSEPSLRKLLHPSLLAELDYLRKIGNEAAHFSQKRIGEAESTAALKMLFRFAGWVVRAYSEDESLENLPEHFDENLLPPPAAVGQKKLEQEKKHLLDELNNHQAELERRDAELRQKDEKIAELHRRFAETERIKTARAEVFAAEPPRQISEAKTRELFIDLLLREAGWNPAAPGATEFEVSGMPNPTGKGFVDYVLWGDDGSPLAIVEAKRTSVGIEAGAQQAKLYADCLERRYGRRPLVFLSNGFRTEFADGRHPRREVAGFYDKKELEWAHQRNSSAKDAASLAVEERIANRGYQKLAIAAAINAFEKERRRRALLVMATGSGKTRTASALVDVLQRAGLVKRVLFLADRTALVKQAFQDFKKHLPDSAAINLCDHKDDLAGARFVFSTYQTMMSAIDSERKDGKRLFGCGYFDLVIVDEAHRSVYQKFGALFRYFDGLLLGLTATPKKQIDKNTFDIFGLPDGDPTFNYDLAQAVEGGFLVPYRLVDVQLKLPTDGIRYSDLNEADRQRFEEDFTDPVTGAMPEEVSGGAINEWVFNEKTIEAVLSMLMGKGLKTEGGDLLGKSIVFARSHLHAVAIERQFRKMYPDRPDGFLQVVDNQVKYADTLIDDFKSNKLPRIAVSVDMLDTGIDVPEILNLVFFKPVRSVAKFWQMIGRGTRLCPDVFAPGSDKQHFYIFDFCRNFEFFGENADGIEPPAAEPLGSRIFWAQFQCAQLLRQAAEPPPEHLELAATLLDRCHAEVAGWRADGFEVQLVREPFEKFRHRAAWDAVSKDDEFQIKRQLAPLAHGAAGEDETARWFDLLALNLMSAQLLGERRQAVFVEKIQNIAQQLTRSAGVPAVAARLPFIRSLTETATWAAASPVFVEKVRSELRDLLQFIEKKGRGIVFTNLEETVLTVQESNDAPLLGTAATASPEAYRRRVESWLNAHQHHLVVHKLRTLQPVTDAEIEQLEDLMFRETAGSREQFEQVLGKNPVSKFVRSIVGLEPQAVEKAFSEFLNAGNLSPQQSRFLQLLMKNLSQNGFVETNSLYDSPYSDVHFLGVAGVFPQGSERILQILKSMDEPYLLKTG